MTAVWMLVRALPAPQREQYRRYVATMERALDTHLTDAQARYLVDCAREGRPPSIKTVREVGCARPSR